MSGFQEILVIVVILMGILFLPRMMPRRIEQGPKRPSVALSRNVRLAIVASIVYPAIAALFPSSIRCRRNAACKTTWRTALCRGRAAVIR